MDFYPVYLSLKGKRCAVIGGGKVAERKICSLLKAGAKIFVVSPKITAKLEELVEKEQIVYKKACYSSSFLQGASLVIAATGDRKVNKLVGKEATGLGIPVNVVDAPLESSFISPAILEKKGFVVAISTDGKSPTLAKKARDLIAGEFEKLLEKGELERTKNTAREKIGMVYLVGAGPGDSELITLRGLRLIKQADVILYDRLVSSKLLSYASRQAELIYVGKRSSKHTLQQDKINKLLVTKAKQGKLVVRLKGGDPFVFGRGGEEALELVRNRIPFELVPGVSSFHGVPACAGIPLTLRGCASSVGIITGREDPTKSSSHICWDKIATGVDTLIILMGVRNLPLIVKELLRSGRPPNTPIALIRWGTTSEQKTLVGTLQDIVAKVEEVNFRPPAVIVVGEVVSLRKQIRWFKEESLQERMEK